MDIELTPPQRAELRYLAKHGPLWAMVKPGSNLDLSTYQQAGLVRWEDGVGWRITFLGMKKVGMGLFKNPCPTCQGSGFLPSPSSNGGE